MQGPRALRRFRREFRTELDTIANEACTLHSHDPEMTRGECLGRRLWDLAQSGECRWATALLLNRWLGRVAYSIDLQSHVAIDLTASLDPSTLARYRFLVTHEGSLTPDEVNELHAFRIRSAVPDLPSPGGGDGL